MDKIAALGKKLHGPKLASPIVHWRGWGLLTLGQGPAGEEDARQAAARELGQLWVVAREEASREAGLGDGSTRGR